MSKDKETEHEFDFNIESIFGGFEPEIEVEKEEETNPEEETGEEVDPVEVEEETEEEEEENSSNEKEEEVEEIEYSYKALLNHLSEEGVLDFEDSEDIEDNPELIKDAIFNTAKNLVEEYKESIPEEGRTLLNYLEKGGDVSKYLETLTTEVDVNTIDLEIESNQKKVVSELLKNQGYSNEEIEETIKDYEDGLILEKQSKLAVKRLEKVYEDRKDLLIHEQEQAILEQEAQSKKYIDEIKTTIGTSDTLGGLQVSQADKKEFEKYLLNRGKDGLTEYEKDLNTDKVKTQLELAYLKFKKFNFAKIAAEVKTKETKRIRGLIKSKDSTVSGKSKNVRSTDEQAGDLSAFKSFL